MQKLSGLLLVWLSLMGINGQPIVQTDQGAILGVNIDSPEVDAFWGIPYAAPPVGIHRFKPPGPAESWGNSTRDCTEPAPKCAQIHLTTKVFEGQEDCLTLDVYVPRNGADNRPVMVFIHGGGFVLGASYDDGHYDGRNLAAQGVIVVYRLNVFGFLALDELHEEASDGGTGNYGLQDQREALRWVNRNIHHFGGNPSNVTIFGESAGGVSVCAHLVSKASRDLFHGAIAESGLCDSHMFFTPLSNASDWGAAYAARVGCNKPGPDRLNCLRFLPTEKVASHSVFPHGAQLLNLLVVLPHHGQRWLTKIWEEIGELAITGLTGFRPLLLPAIPFVPTIDGAVSGVEALPLDLIRRREIAPVPTILGTNHDEGTLFVPLTPLITDTVPPVTDKTFHKILVHFWADPEVVANVTAAYPLHNYASQDDRLAKMMRDYMFACPTRRVANALAELTPTWLYHFNYSMWWPDAKVMGDYHTSELDFVFGTHNPEHTHPFDAKDRQLSDDFERLWTNLAKHGSPCDESEWSTTSAHDDASLAMDVPLRRDSHYLADICEFWDSVRDQTLTLAA